MRPGKAKRRVGGRHTGACCLAACAAFALCLYLLRHPPTAATGARPTLLQQLEHSVAVDEFGDIQLPADQSLAAATSSGAGNVGTGAAAAAAKLPKYAVKPGLGGIFFGKGAVGVHEDTKDPERVFGQGNVADAGSKVRPLGFYFHRDIPQALKDAAAAATPSASFAGADASASLEHLQAVAKHKAQKGAAGGAGNELGFYFAKDIPKDVKAAVASGVHPLVVRRRFRDILRG